MTARAFTPKRDRQFPKRLDQDFLNCRTLRHAWVQTHFGKVTEVEIASRFGPATIVRVLNCMRCGSERFDFFHHHSLEGGEEFRSFYKRYAHAPFYIWKGKTENVDRPMNEDYTREAFRRAK